MLLGYLKRLALVLAPALAFNTVEAGNFNYSSVEVGFSAGETQDYINQELTLANIDNFQSLSFEFKAQPYRYVVPLIELEASYKEEMGLQVFQARGLFGVKAPIALGSRIDISPLAGYYIDYQRLCFVASNCVNVYNESMAYGVDARAWLIESLIEVTAGYRKNTMEERNTRALAGIGLWPSHQYRFGIDWIDLNWTRMLRGTISFVF